MRLLETLKVIAKQLKANLAALYLAYRRKDTPIPAKVAAIVAVAYALSPIDLIPDFIPVLGYLDDIILLPLLIWVAVKLIPPEIMQECRENAQDLWKDGRPKKIWYALPIVLIWAIILAAILRALL